MLYSSSEGSHIDVDVDDVQGTSAIPDSRYFDWMAGVDSSVESFSAPLLNGNRVLPESSTAARHRQDTSGNAAEFGPPALLEAEYRANRLVVNHCSNQLPMVTAFGLSSTETHLTTLVQFGSTDVSMRFGDNGYLGLRSSPWDVVLDGAQPQGRLTCYSRYVWYRLRRWLAYGVTFYTWTPSIDI